MVSSLEATLVSAVVPRLPVPTSGPLGLFLLNQLEQLERGEGPQPPLLLQLLLRFELLGLPACMEELAPGVLVLGDTMGGEWE